MPDPRDPSLLSFLLDRISEDAAAADAGRGAPLPWDEPFVRHFSPPQMMQRARLDQDLVSACVDAMLQAPGQSPAPQLSPADPVTLLGSQLLKNMAARYRDHENYREVWAPEGA